jgi:hypothetical protein
MIQRHRITYHRPVKDEQGHIVAREEIEAEVTVEVDLDKIARAMGYKAIHSKGGRSQDLGGMVVVKASGKQRVIGRKEP